MNKGSALLIVDVQRDFCPGGSLSVARGDEIIPLINRYIRIFLQKNLPILASRDWHPSNSIHFIGAGGVWPVHCLQGSDGARFHPGLLLPDRTAVFSKGMNPEHDDSYSVFQAALDEGESFPEYLKRNGIRKLYVCGIATDYCVKSTVLDALGKGFSVVLLQDAMCGVDLEPGDSDRALGEMIAAGAGCTDIDTMEKSAKL